MIFNWTVRQIRGWCTATYFPSADLPKLCDSYKGEGEMGLPRELIDEIMRYNDLQRLKSCSLTSRTLYSAARPLVHRRMVLGMRSAVRGSRLERLPLYTSNHVDVFYARYLSAAEESGLLHHNYVREVDLDLSFSNPENFLQLQQLRALRAVHTLAVSSLNLHWILPIFDRCFSQFVPTLQSLSLQKTRCKDAHQFMEFVCRFLCLDDLELVNPRGLDHSRFTDAPPGSEGPQPQHPLPLGGYLVINGTGPLVQCLLDLPGGIRFRSIKTSSHLRDLAKLLVACSSTLEVLNIDCIDSGESSTLTLTHRSTEGSPGSHSLTPQASGTFSQRGIRGDAQCRPGIKRDL